MSLDLTLSGQGQCLTSYALFNVAFWDADDGAVQGIHRALLPFLVAALRRTVGFIVTVDEVAEHLKTLFGLEFPQEVLRGMLKAAYRQDVLTRATENDVTYLTINRRQLDQFPEIEEASTEIRREHGQFIRELRDYSRERFERRMDREEAEAALHTLLLDRVDSISCIEDYSNVASEWSSEMSSDDAGYILKRFIEDEVVPGTDLHEYLRRIARGSALAVAVFYRGDQVERLASSMNGLKVYFDTPLLLGLLGYHKPEDRAAVADVLRLVVESGATPCVFEHTCQELRNVLLGAATDMRSAQHGLALESTMPVVESYVQGALGASVPHRDRDRYVLDAERLPVILAERYGFKLEQAVSSRSEQDEESLAELVQTKYAVDPSRRLISFDVKSLLGVDRLRQSRQPLSLDQAEAVFVTTNPQLADASEAFFDTSPRSDCVPLCYTSDALACLLWLKRPLELPDMPWRQVVSYVYAGLYPGDELWRKYTGFLDSLRLRENPISDEDYFVLRFTVGARQALMDSTLGHADLLTVGSITDILTKAKNDLATELQDELDAKIAALDATRRRVSELEAIYSELERAREEATTAVSEALEREPLDRVLVVWETVAIDSRRLARRERRGLEATAIAAIIGSFGLTAGSLVGIGAPFLVAMAVALLCLVVSVIGFRNLKDGWTFAAFESARVARHSARRFARIAEEWEADEGTRGHED